MNLGFFHTLSPPRKDAVMAHKQLFAQIGVFVLLGLNVGAYYVFWPHHDGGSKSEAKSPRQEKGEVHLLPAPPDKQLNTAKPKEFPANPRGDAVPLSIPSSASKSDKEMSVDDPVSKLLDHIKKESAAGNQPPAGPFDEKNYVIPEKQDNPAKTSELPAIRLIPADNKPKPLPSLNADPLLPDTRNPNVGVTSALTPKLPPGPWLLHTEAVGDQTLLVAKLRQPASARPLAEFRVLCDRLETKGSGGDVQAVGRVTFAGAGLKGACQRLTLRLHESRLVFEDQVYLVQETVAAGNLSGDRIVWEIPTHAFDATGPVLGAPK
jgi:hypothetical protein